MKKFFLASLCLFIAIHYTYAQNKITVSGKVFDKDLGQVVIGANILEKGTDNGTVTNVDGMYSISVSSGATLVFSYVGMQTQEVKVNGQPNDRCRFNSRCKNIRRRGCYRVRYDT